jgi:hypothetical protein
MKRVAKNQLRTDEELITGVLSQGLVHLNRVLMDLTRREVAVLLWHEVTTQRRDDFVKRLHQRFGILRNKDEIKELNKTKNPTSIQWLEKEVHEPYTPNLKG